MPERNKSNNAHLLRNEGKGGQMNDTAKAGGWHAEYLKASDRAMAMERERDDYKNHFEACEAQGQQQLAEFIEMRKERDEIKAVEIALAAERDDYKGRLAASVREIERLNIVNKALDESTEIDELRAEVERLKADKARLFYALGNFTHDNLGAMVCICGKDAGECAASIAENAMRSV